MPETNHASPAARLKRALAKADTYVVQVLYYTMGVFLYLNTLALLSGHWLALPSIAIQTLVIASVYYRKSWAYIVVQLWSIVALITGATFWLAVLLRGGEITQSADRILTSNIALILGIYFFRNSNAIRDRSQAALPDQSEAHNIDSQ